MARRGRLTLPAHAHLVLQRGHSGRAVFLDAVDRRAYLDALHEATALSQVAVHAWSLADAEARLLLTPDTADGLSRAMQALGRRYGALHNRRHGRSGTLWDGRFRCAVVEPGAPRLQALVWVDGGGAGTGTGNDTSLTTRTNGALTSAAARTGRVTGTTPDLWLRHPPEYWALGNTPFEREAAYAALLDAGLAAPATAAIARAALGGWVHGSDAFAADLAQRARRPTRPGVPGRPPRRAATG